MAFSYLFNKKRDSAIRELKNKSSGYLFGTTYIDGVIFDHPFYDPVKIDHVTINIDFFSTFFNQITFDLITLEGINTTIDLHKKILNHKKFINSDFDVNWLVKESFY